MERALSLFAALALSACVTATPSGPIVDGGPVRQDGLARIGQPTGVGRIVVTPQALIEDSRCPMNARCVWAGRVVVRTRIDGAGWRETLDLALGQPTPVRGTTIALTSAMPEKMTGQQPAPSDYLFGFEGGN